MIRPNSGALAKSNALVSGKLAARLCEADIFSVVQSLEWAAKTGVLSRSGTGRRSNPFKYWLPGRESELCRYDEFYLPDLGPMEQGAIRRMASALLRAKGKCVDERGRISDMSDD